MGMFIYECTHAYVQSAPSVPIRLQHGHAHVSRAKYRAAQSLSQIIRTVASSASRCVAAVLMRYKVQRVTQAVLIHQWYDIWLQCKGDTRCSV